MLAEALVCVLVATGLAAQSSGEPRVTVHTPQLETFDLALDELELDWSSAPAGRRARPDLVPVRDGQVQARTATRALFVLRRASSTADLVAAARELETANTGARAHVILYEAGKPRSAATRRVLTPRVAVVLENTAEAESTLQAYASNNPQPLASLRGAYVLIAADPLAAIELANQLRTQPGVGAAYPLLERQQFTR